MEGFVRFLYTGDITVDGGSAVVDVLELADACSVDELGVACGRAMASTGRWQDALMFLNAVMRSEAIVFAAQDVSDLAAVVACHLSADAAHWRDIFDCDAGVLCAILSSRSLFLRGIGRSEDEVFVAVMDWMDCDRPSRVAALPRLLPLLRWPHLTAAAPVERLRSAVDELAALPLPEGAAMSVFVERIVNGGVVGSGRENVMRVLEACPWFPTDKEASWRWMLPRSVRDINVLLAVHSHIFLSLLCSVCPETELCRPSSISLLCSSPAVLSAPLD